MDIVRAEDYHVPVLLQECLEGMRLSASGVYVDVTFGGGGHSRAILSHLTDGGHLYSFDQDPDAALRAEEQEQFTFIASNFRHLSRFMDYYDQIGKVDAVLADLGVSSHHFDDLERGFSFRAETPLLDMRMNNREGRSARDLLNEYEEEQLADILYRYGELRQSRRLAQLIVKARSTKTFATVGDLISAVRPAVRPDQEKKQLSCIFQALRIEVNEELIALEELLEGVKTVSLEDRIVKNFLKGSDDTSSREAQIYGSERSPWRMITRKPITPSAEELARNPRSRSAKLRIAELI